MSTPVERLARKKAFAAPDRKDPLAVCRAYMGRLGLSDWAGAAALVDGRSLQSLKKALIQLLAAEPDSLSLLRSMFPRLKNRGDLEKARAEDVFADFLAKVFGSSEELHTAFSQAAFDILAAAEESPEVRHVVYRYRFVLEGVEHSKVAVAPMSLCDGVWSMKADEDIKGLLNGIAMRKRMLRSFEVPDTDSEDEDEVADEGKDEAENEDVEAAADLVTLLKRLGEESLAMEDLEAEILPLLLSEDNDVVLGGLMLLKPLLSVHSLPRVLEQTTSPDHRVRWHALDCLSEGLRFAPLGHHPRPSRRHREGHRAVGPQESRSLPVPLGRSGPAYPAPAFPRRPRPGPGHPPAGCRRRHPGHAQAAVPGGSGAVPPRGEDPGLCAGEALRNQPA